MATVEDLHRLYVKGKLKSWKLEASEEGFLTLLVFTAPHPSSITGKHKCLQLGESKARDKNFSLPGFMQEMIASLEKLDNEHDHV